MLVMRKCCLCVGVKGGTVMVLLWPSGPAPATVPAAASPPCSPQTGTLQLQIIPCWMVDMDLLCVLCAWAVVHGLLSFVIAGSMWVLVQLHAWAGAGAGRADKTSWWAWARQQHRLQHLEWYCAHCCASDWAACTVRTLGWV